MSTTTEVTPPADELVTVTLTDEQARLLRHEILYEASYGDEDGVETRDALQAIADRAHQALERLDALGWDDDRGTREYTDDRERLLRSANAVVYAGHDALGGGWGTEDALAEARHRLAKSAAFLAGLGILEQLTSAR